MIKLLPEINVDILIGTSESWYLLGEGGIF